MDVPRGTFHHHKGYNYFRFVEGRLLLGGGRHLNPQAEAKLETNTSEEIQHYLQTFAQEKLGIDALQVTHRWSGFMGVGKAKMPKLEKDKEGRIWAVRLGGMGVALGTEIGQRAAALCLED
jgi:glycine/D-amino acid oxidase-like deaminating enzyme